MDMNKNILIFIVIFSVAFASGLIGALYIGGTVTNHALYKVSDLAENLNPSTDEQRRFELWTKFALAIDHKARNGDMEGLLQTSCLMLNMHYLQLNPNLWSSNARKERALEIKEKSRLALEKMFEEKVCEN
jgi:hypothetical protein